MSGTAVARLDARDRPSVSIILPTYNRRARLLRLLRSLAGEHAAGGRFEVVVAVDGATDGTAEALARLQTPFPLVILLHENGGPAAARNRAIAAASGDLLLFLDDDVIAVPGLIERHLAAHVADPCAVVIGTMRPPPDLPLAPWLRWEATTLQKQYDAMLAGLYAATPRQFYTANASLRRALAERAGCFDETFTRGEDVEFGRRLERAGGRFQFEPEARVWHEPDRSLAAWLRVPYQYGWYDAQPARGPGEPSLLDNALEELEYRHPLNRLIARVCVGHIRRRRAVVAALGAFLRLPAPALASEAQRLACSALFTVQYWQGVADAKGLGSRVWSAGALAAAGGAHQCRSASCERERASS